MHRAIETAPTNLIKADVSADLAFETLMRSGMWTSRPGTEMVGPAIAHALAFAEPFSRARAKALVAQAFLSPERREAASDARAIAEKLDDPLLLSYALDAERAVAVQDGDYERVWSISLVRLELIDQISDPDAQADIVQTLVAPAVANGHFDRAAEFARRHDETARPLTAHHGVHAVAGLVELGELLGRWEDVRALEERVRTAVAANADTQCTQGPRSLLVCAIAAECLGDHEAAVRLEAEADALGLPGRHVLDAPRLRLALLRREHDRANELLETLLTGVGWYGRGHWTAFSTILTEIEAAGVLGRGELLDQLRTRLVRPGPYLTALIQRADGLMRGDAGAAGRRGRELRAPRPRLARGTDTRAGRRGTRVAGATGPNAAKGTVRRQWTAGSSSCRLLPEGPPCGGPSLSTLLPGFSAARTAVAERVARVEGEVRLSRLERRALDLGEDALVGAADDAGEERRVHDRVVAERLALVQRPLSARSARGPT